MAKNTYRGSNSGRDRRRREEEPPSRQQTRNIRRYADDDYEDEEYEWEERNTSRKARNGCLIALLVTLVLVLALVVAGVLYLKSEMDGNRATATEEVTIEVMENYGGRTMGTLLEESGLIGNSTIFRYYVQVKGVGSDFKAGFHTFTPGMSYEEIIIELSTPPPARNEVVIQIPESWSVMSVANLFAENGFCTAEEFLAEADALENYSDIRFIAKLLEEEAANPDYLNVFHRSEGYLFPDTYSFFSDDDLPTIVRKLYENTDSKLTDEFYAQLEATSVGLAGEPMTLHDAVTMASMLLSESGDVEQMDKVSSVFWNRLSDAWESQGGTMDSDVTVRYIKKWMQINLPEYAGKTFPEITYDEARQAVGDELFFAYCTDVAYEGTRKGLPSGPICAATWASLEAVVNPNQEYIDVYYYFLTDYYGNYYYGKTLAEHNQNVATMNEMNAKYEQEQAASQQETQQSFLLEMVNTVPKKQVLLWPPRKAA